MSAAAKRTFLFRTFHPLGPHVCAMTGMVGASDEVTSAEFSATQYALDSVPDPVIERALLRSQWVVEVLGSDEWGGAVDITSPIGEGEYDCPDCGEPCQAITLQEILVKFYLAMRLEEEDAHGQLVR